MNDCFAERLAYLRTILEKLRPLETKLKYQIDKLVKAATVGAAQTDVNPLSFKPNPSGLVSKVADAPASDDDDGPAVYQPPKLSAVPYCTWHFGLLLYLTKLINQWRTAHPGSKIARNDV